MIRSSLLAVAGFAALAASTLPARAWDPVGHMLVGQIACDQLTPTAKAGVDAAIARFNAKDSPHDSPYDEVTISCWMDDIRSRPEMKPYAVWHYINLPYTPDGRPVPDASAGPNVVLGIEKTVDILTGKTTDSAIDKDQALAILMHLVGDIHQPLHTTNRNDDAGGNKVKVANLKDPLADLIFTKGGNLHFFWDSAYRRVYRDGSATVLYESPLYDRAKPVAGHAVFKPTIRAEATALEKKYPPSIVKEQGDGLSWALESHAIGYVLGYQKLPATSETAPVKLTETYVTDARNCAEQRIVLAGYRLGNLLNQIFANPQPAADAAPVPSPTAPPAGTPERLLLPSPSTGNPAE